MNYSFFHFLILIIFINSEEVVRRFLDSNNLISIVRAHEAQLEGFK